MSTSIHNAMSSQPFLKMNRNTTEFSAQRKTVDNAGDRVEGRVERLKNQHTEMAIERRQERLESLAEKLASRTEAVTARFDEMGVRLTERFALLEEKARESGYGVRAESIAEITARLSDSLDNASDRMVTHLNTVSDRINTILSGSYGNIGEDVSNSDDSTVNEVV
ncbi:MAG: hypothetical protein WBN68_15880 [Sedimenticolaceae bacterium]